MFRGSLAVRYAAGAAAYEALRCTARLWDGRVRDYGAKEARPLLLSEKAAAMACCVAYAPVVAPLHAWLDLGRAEVWARGWDAERFGVEGWGAERRHWLGYVVS